eukprot:scaffold77299_cov52-Cyclotella_meneghiniana.AAC.3
MMWRLTHCSCCSRSLLCVLSVLLIILSNKTCISQSDESGLSEDVFTKPTYNNTLPPSLAPSQTPDQIDPASDEIFIDPTETDDRTNTSKVYMKGESSCSISRDTYCVEATQVLIDGLESHEDYAISEALTDLMVGQLGMSYEPFVSANIDYWNSSFSADGAKETVKPGWKGFAFPEESQNYQVKGLAMGVIVKSISDIDSVQGTYMASIKLYFWNITKPFQTMREAVDKMYQTSSRTTRKDHCGRTNRDRNCTGHFYRLHDHDLPGAWEASETDDGEVVRPDGICNPSAVTSMQPIKANDFVWENVLRMPQLTSRILPTIIADDEGYLTHVEIEAVPLKFRPINRKFYPMQIDLLDMVFEMHSSNLIDEDQNIVQRLLCFHPSFTGFSNHVFGSDAEADLFLEEPWYNLGRSQLYYGKYRQKLSIGNGNYLQRMLGLRIIVKVNSLVTQNTHLIGQHTVMGQSLLLAYGITSSWIVTIVIMTAINSAKAKDSMRTKWFVTHQLAIFRYFRMFNVALTLIYVPLLAAYQIDEGNGEQSRLNWIWGLVIAAIVLVFAGRVLVDYRSARKQNECKKEDDIQGLLVFSTKPLNLWTQDEVLRWVKIEILAAAAVDGDLLSEQGFCPEKLVKLGGLAW